MIYFTSDTHFGHNRDFIFKPRGFEDIVSHDRKIIDNWNSIVTDEDTVYVLGDVMLKDNENGVRCWNQLKGNKKIILGNHDSNPRIEALSSCPNTEILGYADMLDYGNHHFFLSHYPSLTANYDDNKQKKKHVYNVCGHIHASDRFCDMDKGVIYHVDLDCHNMTPVSIEEVISDIDGWLKEHGRTFITRT